MNRYDLCPVRPSEVRAAIANARSIAVPPTHRIPVTVFGINEATPGPRWKALFDATWPGYRAWYLSQGDAARPDLPTAARMLASHMPELVPTYERLVDLAGGDEVAARMLTLWDTPAFAPACAQAVLTGPEPALCRNYDYGVDLWERTVYTSAFTGRRVIGSGDCLWGSAGRDERCRAGHFAGVRRAPRLRSRIRHPDRAALPVGGGRHRRAGARGVAGPADLDVVQPDDGGRRRRIVHRVRRPRQAGGVLRSPRRHQSSR